MAEVTVSDNLELGMEFALQDLLFSEQATLHPVTGMPVGPDFDLTLGTDIGAAGASGLGGFSFTVSGEDFNFLLRALQGEGRADIQSRPSIMVQDGQQARIAIGQEVPVVSQFGVTAGGVVTPQIEYRDAKIELEVRPLINRDGYVNMEISSMIKSLAQSSVSIGGGVNAPIIQSREAETFVTVKDGETIIIGGLITMQDNVSENKVPIAGDIPILGNLFRSSVDTTSKTELLIVLTPHVVRVDKEARDLSIYLRDQTGLNENIRTSPLMQGLQTKPGENHKMENGEKPASLNPSSEDERSGSDGEEAGEREAPKGYGPAVEVIRRDQLSPKSKQRSVAIRREE
jgi:type II secretory pathway component GspD/PulD (secretin)